MVIKLSDKWYYKFNETNFKKSNALRRFRIIYIICYYFKYQLS